MDWLNNNNKDAGTGLLLAPINAAINAHDLQNITETPGNDANILDEQEILFSRENSIQEQNIIRENPANNLESRENITDTQELLFTHEDSTHDEHENITPSSESEITSEQDITSTLYQNLANSLESYDPDQFIANSQNFVPSSPSIPHPPTRPVEGESLSIHEREKIINSQDLPDINNMNKAQQEAATGFQLSLDEPPPELWSNISNDDDEDSQESSQLYEHYEQGINFQEYNNQTPHGKNFTQRLQRILHERQERASEQKKSEPVQNSYIKKAAIMCTSLVITLLIAWLVLIYLQKKTPDYLNAKALALYNSGEYEQAANEYQRAYKLYPDILTFLTGLAISSEKAGHLQTAKISWEEYINLLPENDSSDKEFARNELNRLNNNEREKTESPQIIPEHEPEPAKIEPQKTPPTFKELMREGTEALNLGIYNNAIINFSQAIELNPKDLRAYIGLAAAYRNKGLYFDAKRIIDDAIKKFGKNPTLLTELNFLKEAN